MDPKMKDRRAKGKMSLVLRFKRRIAQGPILSRPTEVYDPNLDTNVRADTAAAVNLLTSGTSMSFTPLVKY